MLQTFEITPPPSSSVAAELPLPLRFFDILWLHFHPIRRLVFYDLPCSEAEFLNSIVPNLKHSLSLTLKHYLPVAGNILYPLDTDKSKPVIRYVTGDSVPLTVAVSSHDFDDLTGHHARDSDQFYDFMPAMPPLKEEAEHKVVPLIALQVTLFPGRGICIGLSNHHSLGDARSVVGFMSAWGEINKRGGDEEFLSSNGDSLPLFDRSVVGDVSRIDEEYWSIFKNIPLKPSSFPLPTNRVRSSFTLRPSDIKNLKNLLLSKKPELVHVSSFVVTAAYTWSCLVKSADAAGEEVSDDKSEIIFVPADGRGRPNALVDPPVPLNYFGNCLGGGTVKLKHKEVAAEEGFVAAAEAISDKINKDVNNKEKFLDVSDSIGSFSEMRKLLAVSNAVGISGSAKFDLSNVDFGWGKGRKLEVLSMDGEKYAMSMCNSRDSAGGLVVGTSLPRERMEAFAAIFQDGLKF